MTAAVLLIALLAATPGDAADRAHAAASAGDVAGAVAVLEALASDEGATRQDLVAAAKAAEETLPREEGHRAAAPLLARALLEDRSDRDGAWTLAMRVRRALIEDGDAGAGAPLLRTLADVYPDQAALYRRNLAWLLVDAGRPREARDAFDDLLAADPADTRSARMAASLDELLGDTDAALARYDRLVEQQGDARSAQVRANLLWRLRGDFDAAAASLAEARRLVEALGEGEDRDELTAAIEAEQRALDDAVRTANGLRDLTTRQRTLLAVIAACWIAALGAGTVFLRRVGENR